MKIDQYGMILPGTPPDGGDSCNKMYTAYIRLCLLHSLGIITSVPAPFDDLDQPPKAQNLLEPNQDGIYIRNPDKTQWYSDPRNLSRDQLVPVICFHAMMAQGHDPKDASAAKHYQSKLLKQCLKRLMFAQNIYPNWIDPRIQRVNKKIPDVLTPDLWGMFARTYLKSFWAPLAILFILLGDTFLVISAFARCFAPITIDGTLKFRFPGPDDVDDDNMNNVLMTTQYIFPTPLSWLARKIYKRFRPQNYGNTELGEKSAIMGALAWYNRHDKPEMTEIARPLVERY